MLTTYCLAEKELPFTAPVKSIAVVTWKEQARRGNRPRLQINMYAVHHDKLAYMEYDPGSGEWVEEISSLKASAMLNSSVAAVCALDGLRSIFYIPDKDTIAEYNMKSSSDHEKVSLGIPISFDATPRDGIQETNAAADGDSLAKLKAENEGLKEDNIRLRRQPSPDNPSKLYVAT
jgi:hypothetical protein